MSNLKDPTYNVEFLNPSNARVNWMRIRADSPNAWNHFINWLSPNAFIDMKGNLCCFDGKFFTRVPILDAVLFITEKIGSTDIALVNEDLNKFGVLEPWFLLVEDEYL
jgi:hypothetical protein